MTEIEFLINGEILFTFLYEASELAEEKMMRLMIIHLRWPPSVYWSVTDRTGFAERTANWTWHKIEVLINHNFPPVETIELMCDQENVARFATYINERAVIRYEAGGMFINKVASAARG